MIDYLNEDKDEIRMSQASNSILQYLANYFIKLNTKEPEEGSLDIVDEDYKENYKPEEDESLFEEIDYNIGSVVFSPSIVIYLDQEKKYLFKILGYNDKKDIYLRIRLISNYADLSDETEVNLLQKVFSNKFEGIEFCNNKLKISKLIKNGRISKSDMDILAEGFKAVFGEFKKVKDFNNIVDFF